MEGKETVKTLNKPRIIKAGNDPDCIHYEHIDGEMHGTCLKCGQIKDYNPGLLSDNNPDIAPKRIKLKSKLV